MMRADSFNLNMSIHGSASAVQHLSVQFSCDKAEMDWLLQAVNQCLPVNNAADLGQLIAQKINYKWKPHEMCVTVVRSLHHKQVVQTEAYIPFGQRYSRYMSDEDIHIGVICLDIIGNPIHQNVWMSLFKNYFNVRASAMRTPVKSLPLPRAEMVPIEEIVFGPDLEPMLASSPTETDLRTGFEPVLSPRRSDL